MKMQETRVPSKKVMDWDLKSWTLRPPRKLEQLESEHSATMLSFRDATILRTSP